MRRAPALPVVILALLHLYVGWRLLPALESLPLQIAAGVALLASMWLVPSVLLKHAAPGAWLARLQVWSGLIAAGWFSSLFVMTLLRDLLLIGARLAAAPDALATQSARIVLGLSVLASLVGFINARRIARVVDVTVPVKGLPAALEGFTIAHITDLHVGPTIRRNYVEGVVARVNRLDADMVAITGDLVDGSVQVLSTHTSPLSGLKSRHGSFLVTGNHEYYSHAPSWIAEFRRLGLHVLLNEHVLIRHEGETVVVAGVTDFTAHMFVPEHRSDPARALAGAPASAGMKLLLAHQPRTAPLAAQAGYDLQLSGHTHGGQFFPWNFFVPLQQPFTSGLRKAGDLWVYISRGTGYWGPPKRLGAPSEIARVRLVAA